MEEKNTQNIQNIDTTNIFDDFVNDKKLINEVDSIKKEKEKDMFFYLSKVGHVFQIMFWSGLFILIILFSYIYIQNNSNISNSNLLDPFCPLILGNIELKDTYCSSITSIKNSYETDLENTKQIENKQILTILERLYKVENFLKSKEVLFLVDKSENKLKTLSILTEFDNLKNTFNIDKAKIQCNGITIDSQSKKISMSCDSYSQGYEKGLRGLDGSTDSSLKGTSLSIANSFLNYIEKTSDVFEIVDRQKMFREESVLGTTTGFTSKTTFTLNLKYNLNK